MRYLDELPASQERGEILVVDDSRYNRDYLPSCWRSRATASSAPATARKRCGCWGERRFDLVLLDLHDAGA